MSLPFTSEQFFGIFAQYNRSFLVVVVVLWLATIASLTLARRRADRWSPALSLVLGALWLWNAIAYHAFLFTRINPAAWLFALMFAVQAVLFVDAGWHRRLVYFSSSAPQRFAGLTLGGYSLAYPFLTMALGHDYPATPTYGVPCPTVILTIGLLLTTRDGWRLRFAAIPILWAFIGGSAATLLHVPTDYVLLAAGVILLAWVVLRARRMRRAAT
jgi:hypothetical protein